MSEQTKIAALAWAEPTQRSSARSALRGAHRLTGTEPGSRTVAIQIPEGLAQRIYEQHVLSAPGVAEGFEHANKAIEDWKQSL
jgi:hypothetical protein